MRILSGLLVLISVNLCFAMDVYSVDKPNIVVRAKNPEFEIRLKSNPTTGFSWFLNQYDRNFIQPIKHEYEVPPKNLVGAPGYEIWTFRITSEGFLVPRLMTLSFSYTRPWEHANDQSNV